MARVRLTRKLRLERGGRLRDLNRLLRREYLNLRLLLLLLFLSLLATLLGVGVELLLLGGGDGESVLEGVVARRMTRQKLRKGSERERERERLEVTCWMTWC